jgi:DNA polymerase-3 subunit delta
MSLHYVRGNDPVLRDAALDELVRELLGDDDRTLALEDLEIPGRTSSEGELGGAEARLAVVDAVLNAVCTLPFMSERRVVVVREVGNLTKEEAAPIVAYAADQTPTTELVLVAGGGPTVRSLDDAVKTHGTVRGPESEKAAEVLTRAAGGAGIRLDREARELVLAHVGSDAGLIPGLVQTLAAVHGEGADLGAGDVAPYLGDEGSIPSWELTNAIERGNVAEALAVLQRLLTVTSPTSPRPAHPLQVMGMLHSHYRKLLRLDDPSIGSGEAAASALGGRTSPRAAAIRLRHARQLGTAGIRQAFDHLARADLDLKGDRAIPEGAVMEMLVVRLARISVRSR